MNSYCNNDADMAQNKVNTLYIYGRLSIKDNKHSKNKEADM